MQSTSADQKTFGFGQAETYADLLEKSTWWRNQTEEDFESLGELRHQEMS